MHQQQRGQPGMIGHSAKLKFVAAIRPASFDEDCRSPDPD